MAVQAGWVGSQAVAETGQRWMSAARTTLRLPAAGWMSEMVGRSKFTHRLTIGAYKEGGSWAYGYFMTQGAGSISPADFAGYRIQILGPQTYINQIRFSIGGVLNGRRMRMTIEGLGSREFTYKGYDVLIDFGEPYRWFRDRNGQTVNVLLELL